MMQTTYICNLCSDKYTERNDVRAVYWTEANVVSDVRRGLRLGKILQGSNNVHVCVHCLKGIYGHNEKEILEND